MNKPTKQSNAARWMLEGIKQHKEFVTLFNQAKDRGFAAGMFFLTAKSNYEHGDWGAFVAGYSNEISERTVHRYMEFASEVLEWVKAQNPKLLGMEKISEAGRAMVLKSPKGFIALCRELKLMRKFGEYDEVKYRAKKLLGNSAQIEFDFAQLASSLDVLTHFGDENYRFKYPEGVDEGQYIDEVETKLEAALRRVRDIKQNGRAIDVSPAK